MAKGDPKTFLELHRAPIIIDEAQKAPELFPELEKIVNESRLKKGNKESNGLYILSGSQRQKFSFYLRKFKNLSTHMQTLYLA